MEHDSGMKSENEFTKPLKRIDERQQSTRGKGALVALALCTVCALPVFHFYGGLSGYGDQPEPPVEIVLQTPDEADAAPAIDLETTATVPSRNHVIDLSKGDFQEVKPSETLVPLKPTPTLKPLPKAAPIKRQELALAHLPDPQLIERGASGVIPKVSPDGIRAMDLYSRQPDTEGNFGVARVVIVVGGLGISQTSTKLAIDSLPPNVTLAFAPYGNSLNRWMQTARKAGHELLLQLPMEPIDYPQNNPGPHTLRTEADLEENLANLHWAMSRLTNYVGVTNYLGNKILQQPAGLSPIFAEISKRGLMFFEDGTVQNSMGPGVAVKELVPYARAEILIDNVRSRSAIASKLNELAAQAKRTGLAIGMANAFPDSIAMISEFARRSKQNGIEITPVTAVVKDPNK